MCHNISDALGHIGSKEDGVITQNIVEELNHLDDVAQDIENDEKNKTLYMLLITHISDIRFLFLSREEQDKILENMK